MILQNNIAKNDTGFSETMFGNGLSIYEVIRVFRGHPIFLGDNLLRLDNSLKKSKIDLDISTLHIPDKLNHLISLEHIEEGNLKYVLHFTTGNTPDEYIYQIPHAYPSLQDYENGVDTLTYHVVRENPEVKYINSELRALSNQLIKEHQIYEILLTDDGEYITEGSRSNVFFIKNDTLYTAPTDYVLPGTSRKRVFDICKQENITIIEQRVALSRIGEYDAAFLTGTSPLILPIRKINDVLLNPQNQLLKKTMKSYFSLVESVF